MRGQLGPQKQVAGGHREQGLLMTGAPKDSRPVVLVLVLLQDQGAELPLQLGLELLAGLGLSSSNSPLSIQHSLFSGHNGLSETNINSIETLT